MSIELTDIPAAVADYIDNHVTTAVTDVVPDNASTGLMPGADGSVTVTVMNATASAGVRLINLRLHLEVNARKNGDPDPDTDPDATADARQVAELIAPPAPGADYKDNEGNVVGGGQLVSSGLVIKYTDDRSTLEAGDSVIQKVSIACKKQGDVNVTCHIHADVDQSALFPNSKGRNGAGRCTVA